MKLSVLIVLIPILFVCCTQVEQSCSSNEIAFYEQLSSERNIIRIGTKADTIYPNELKNFYSENNSELVNNTDTYRYCKDINHQKVFTDYWVTKSSLLSENDINILYNTIDSLSEKTAYYKISYPLFNKTFNKALIKITYECGKYCSHSEFSLYEKQNDKWKLSKKISNATW